MIPLPTPKVFRSRGGALWWSFWVIVGAVLFVGFGSPDHDKSGSEATISDADVQALAATLNGG
jgi:hypothetical protein